MVNGRNREVLAETIIKLRNQGAGVIVMPILFSEKDRLGGDGKLCNDFKW